MILTNEYIGFFIVYLVGVFISLMFGLSLLDGKLK